MIFWIVVILFAIGVLACVKAHYSDYWALLVILPVTTGFIAFLMLVCIIFANIGKEAERAELETRYDALVYQYQSSIYDDDVNYGKRELVKDIQEWNEELSYNKRISHDFWVGIFHPDIYDDLEYIELTADV